MRMGYKTTRLEESSTSQKGGGIGEGGTRLGGGGSEVVLCIELLTFKVKK